MKLPTPFCRLPVRFDVARLRDELSNYPESAWVRHPSNFDGNSAIRLISVEGQETDGFVGPMKATPHLQVAPYVQQVLASFGVVWSRSRLMRLAPGAEVREHVDINPHWVHRVRVHIPITTVPEVLFHCGGETVHMAAGEAWIFDNWRLHRVENPSPHDRVHLVADTTGSAAFWAMAAAARSGRPDQFVPHVPGAPVRLALERFNAMRVMPPAEVEQLLGALVAELLPGPGEPVDPDSALQLRRFQAVLDGFAKDWRQLWSLYADGQEGIASYRARLDALFESVEAIAAPLQVRSNGTPALKVLSAWLQPAVNVQPAAGAGPSPPPSGPAPRSAPARPRAAALPPLSFERPVFIVAAPRSGSTALFEALACSQTLLTVGGEAHGLVEGFAHLRPGAPGVDSNRVTGEHVTEELTKAVLAQISERLRSAGGQAPAGGSTVRFLEKTPKNALRIPFFNRLFPDALFVFLWRDPRENISSIIEAWKSGGWVTYPRLAGWQGPWSLLLPPGWQALAGRPLAEVAAFQWSTTNRLVMDDLELIEPERRLVLSYADFITDPRHAVRRICTFAGIPYDGALEARVAHPMPLSRHTLTAPRPDKWRSNAAAIEPLMPGMEPLWQRLRRFR